MPPRADSRPGGPYVRRRFLAGPWPAVLLGALCYANLLWGFEGFVYDDRWLIESNPRVRSLSNFRDLWLTEWWQPFTETSVATNPGRDRLYRPLTLYTFALNYAVGGLDPFGFRLTNVLLHAIACGLVWKFAYRLLQREGVASIAAALFAVHPVHCDAVSGIVGRAEILAAAFLLLGLVTLAPRDRPPGAARGMLAGLLFFAALMAKETAVCYPAVALLLLLHRYGPGTGAVNESRADRRANARWWAVQLTCLLVPLLVYFPLRFHALEHHLIRTALPGSLTNPLSVATWPERITGSFTILGWYTRVLLNPARLSCDYGQAIIDPQAGPDGMTLLGIVAAAALAAALLGYLRRPGVWRTFAVLSAMTLASYVLISNTIVLIGVALAERLMYWSSALVLTMLALAVVELYRRQCAAGRPLHGVAGFLRVIGVALIAALGVRTAVRNTDWSSTYVLFERDVATYPRGAHLNRGYANELLTRSRQVATTAERDAIMRLAWKHLDAALAIRPEYPDALLQRGQVLGYFGHADRALRDFEVAADLDPHNQQARQALAELKRRMGQTLAPLEELQAAVATQPADAGLRIRLGMRLIEEGQHRAAREQLEEAARLAPNDGAALRALGQGLALVHEYDRAIEVLRRAVAIDDADWESHANLTTLLADKDPAAALRHAQRAHALQPADYRCTINLAEAYVVNGHVDDALKLLRPLARALPATDPRREVVVRRIADLERMQR
jgi:tetratricopeptide (TPR) repeat protein